MAGNGASLNVGASTSAFNSAMKSMVADMKNVQSEFNLASTQAKLFGTETDNLKAKQTQLTSAISIQNNMVNTYSERIKTIANNIDSMKTKQSDLTAKIQDTTEKYKESVAETGKDSEASKALEDELDKLNKQYTALDKSIASNTNNMNNLESKMSNTKASLLENNKALDDTNNKLKTSSLDEFSTKMDKVSSSTGKVANAMAPASLAIGGIGVASAKASVDFETSMAKVFTIADETQVSYGDMKKAIMDLSTQTGISANEIADDVYEAISSGQSTGDAVNFVSNATKLATAGFTSSSSALDVLTTIMNSYGMSADQVTNVSDKLITTQNLGKVTVDQLAQSMGKVIPTAQSAGVNLDNVGTAYALMTSKGIDSAESTTYINSAINELSKSGTNASNALQQMTGETFQQLISSGKSLGDIFGIMADGASASGKSLNDLFSSQEAGKAAMVLGTDSGKDFDDMLNQMQNSAGATQTAFDKMDKTTGQDLKKSFNELKNAGINLGDALAPITSQISGGLSDIAKFLSSLNQEQLKTIATVGLMVIGFTGLMKTVSTVAGGLSALSSGFSILSKGFSFITDIEKVNTKLPLLGKAITSVGGIAKTVFTTVIGFFEANPVVLGITIAIAAIILLYNKCTWFRDGVNEIFSWIANLFTVTLPNAFNSIVTWFTELPSKLPTIWENIKTAFSTGWNNIVTFFATAIPSWIDSVVNWFGTLPDKIGYEIGLVIGTLAKWAVDVVNWITTNVPTWIDNIVNFFAELPDKIWTWLVNVVTKITTWGINMTTWVTTNIPLLITNIVNYFSQLPSKIWGWLVQVVTNVETWGTNMLTTAETGMQTVYDGIVNTFTTLPDRMLEIGTNLVKGLWSGIKNSASWLMDQIDDFADSIIDGFKDAFDIHSPSRIMRDLIGTNIVKGISIGVQTETPNLQNAINSNMNGVISSLDQTVNVVTNGINVKDSSNGSTSSSNNSDSSKNNSINIQSILDKLDEVKNAVNISINGQSLMSYTNNNLALNSKRVR